MQTLEKQIVSNRGNPNWKSGVSGNPNGRPKNPEKRDLQNALRAVKRKHNNVDFLHHIADQAYENTSVGLAVFHKLVPNAENPKEDENRTFQPIIIIRPEGNITKDIPGQLCIQSKEVSGDVEQLGNGKDDVLDSAGDALHGASQEQSGGNLSERIRRPQEFNDQGL